MEAKIVFITGASSGIGEGCARKFAREGWNLILNARTVSKLEELKAELEGAYGVRVYILPFDVRDRKLAAASLESLPEEWKAIEVFPGITAAFTDVGHLLGSASITLQVTENGESQTIVFSGDIGNLDQPLIRNPQYLTNADFVVMESTYGDRTHGPKPDYVAELTQILQETFDRGGNVVIPSFAVGRTQEMLYFIRQIKEEHRIHGHDNFPVFVDSPLAVGATTIFNEHHKDCFDEEAMELVNKGINPITFPGLKLSITSEESKSINFDDRPKVIISASGMCDAGRIKHHLKHNLWRPECTVLFVGYQAIGTPGRFSP